MSHNPNTRYAAIIDAELSVIGGVLIAKDPLEVLAALELERADFFDPRAAEVFDAMRAIESDHAGERRIDPVTLGIEIDRRARAKGLDHDPDVFKFLGEAAFRVPTAENTVAYAAEVRNASQIRRLGVSLDQVLLEVRSGAHTADELLSMAHEKLGEIDREQPTAAVTIGDIATRRWKQIGDLADARERGEVGLSGFQTGVAALDAKIGGYQPGIVHLIAARPSMGKSSLLIAGAEAGSFAGEGWHVFSQEDSLEAYGDRVLARQSGIAAEVLRNADFAREDMRHVMGAVAKMRMRGGWLVDFTTGMTAEQIIRRARRHKRSNGTKVVAVDYVQLVRKRDPRQSDNEAWAEIITQFADAAQHDGLAYVVLSQLNRDLEKRGDKRPQLSDLRGSGGLEERPRVVIGVYRGSFYGGEPQRHVDWDCDCPEGMKACEHKPTQAAWEETAQLLVLKNTNGRRGRVWARWHGPTTRIW